MVSFAKLQQVPATARAHRVFWHLLSVGSVSRDEQESHAGADKAGLHLFWVRSGSGWLITPAGKVRLEKAARCWLVDLRQPRRYVPDTARSLVTASFRFTGTMQDAWLDFIGGAGSLDLPKDAFTHLESLHRDLIQLAAKPTPQSAWHVHQHLTTVWGLLIDARHSLDQTTTDTPDSIRRVIATVTARPEHDWQARDLAEIAGQSYSGLRAAFKAARGETLHTFLQKTRLDHACVLLGDERVSIKQIASSLDFRSESYFTHWFRRHTAQTPSGFRSSQRG
jgi:AraC-like DNA-binding protein